MIIIKSEFDAPAHNSKLSLLEPYGEHPCAYLALNRETALFTSSNARGFIAYRDRKGCRFGVAGINSPNQDKAKLFSAFLTEARQQKKHVIMVQCLSEDVKHLQRHGFVINQLGSSYAIELKDYSIKGTRFIKLRNKISKAKRASVKVLEIGRDVAISGEIISGIQEIDRLWLVGKKAEEIAFLIGEIGDLRHGLPQHKRLFVALNNNSLEAYILYSRTFGSYSGWMHDLTRRKPNCITGVMEYINKTALDKFKQEGEHYLNLGFTPLAELNAANEISTNRSRGFGNIARWLAEHGSFIYPMKTQLQYKKKWYPQHCLPEYIGFEGKFKIGGLWQFLKITNSI